MYCIMYVSRYYCFILLLGAERPTEVLGIEKATCLLCAATFVSGRVDEGHLSARMPLDGVIRHMTRRTTKYSSVSGQTQHSITKIMQPQF